MVFDEIDHFHPNFDESVPNPTSRHLGTKSGTPREPSWHTMGLLPLCWEHMSASSHQGTPRTFVHQLESPISSHLDTTDTCLTAGDTPALRHQPGGHPGLEQRMLGTVQPGCWPVNTLSAPVPFFMWSEGDGTPPAHLETRRPRQHVVPFFMMWSLPKPLSTQHKLHLPLTHGLQRALLNQRSDVLPLQLT